jgi:hypothetical protein
MRLRTALLIIFSVIFTALIIGGIVFLRSSYFLHYIRVTIEDRLEKQFKQSLLFSLRSELQRDMEGSQLSSDLRRAFEANGISFSKQVKLSVREKDSEWLITDRDKNAKFIVRKEAKQLNVYKNLVKFGDFSGDILTGVTITEFEIADKHPQNPPLISADEIELKYNLWGLLRGRLFIINLTINKPELNIHTQPDGRLNVTDLVREKNGGSSGIKIPFWSPVLDVKVDDGTVNFKENKRDLTVTIGGIDIDFEGPLEEWDHSGRLTVEGKDFELNGVETKIDNFTVKFKLPEDKVELTEFHLEFGDSFLTGSCTVSDLKGKSPDINATANLTLDLQDLQRFLNDSYNMEGKVEVDDIEARGTLSNLKGNFELNLPLFTLNEHELKNLTTIATFTQDTFKLTEIRGTLASGAVTGYIELRKAEIPSAEGTTTGGLAYQGQLELAGSQADELVPMLNILPEDFPVLKGDVHGKIEFSGNSVHSDDLKMSGDLQLDRATLNDEDLHASAAHWQIEADQLHLSANFDASQIQLDGAFGLASQQDLALKIEQIDVGKLTRIFRVLDVAGDGTLTAKIDHEAKMTGLFRIPDVSINKVPSGVLTADFLYEAGNLLLQPMRLSKENSEITLNGDVLLEGPMPVKLAVDVQPLYIPDHVKLLSGDDYPIEGVATGALALDGTLEKLDARGRLEIVEGKMWDLALDTLTLPLEIEDYVLKISGFELLSRQQRGILDFQFKMESGDYELAFQSEPMRLAELAIASGVTDFQLDGDVIVKATGNANASDPLVDVTADFSDITYAGHPLRDVYITGVFKKDAPEKEGALKFEGVGFDGASQITGTLWAAEESPYQIFVENVGLDITPFLPIFYNGLEKTWPALNDATGTANGTLEIAGTLVDLTRYTLKMYVPQLSLHVNGQELINSDRIELSFEDDVWKVHSLTLADVRTPDALLIRANGEFTVQRITEPDSNPQRGQINEFSTLNGIRFVAESEGVALEHLASILGLPPTVSGDVAYQLIGNGTYDNPIFDLRWSLPNLSIETLQASIVPSIVEEKSLSRPISEAQGQLLYKNRKLTVESFDFLLLGNRVTVQGDVQVDTDVPQSTVFNLQSASPKFRLDSLETSLLPSLSHLDGLLNIQLHLAGTAATPKLTGTIIGTEATMQVLDFPHPIEKMNFDLQIASGDNASDTLLAVALKSADWQVGERPYKASGSWQLSKTGSQSSLINLLSAPNLHDGVNFQLALEGREVNLKHFVDYLWSTDAGETETAWKIPLEAGEVDLSLSVQGDGYSPAQISSQLTCDNLLLNVNGHEVTNIDPIRFRFADAKLHIESLEVGEASPQPVKKVAWFGASGNIDVDGNLGLKMALTEPPFTVLMPGITVPLFNTAIWLEGSLTSNISIEGNLSNPIIRANWRALSLGGAVEEVAEADYKDRMLTIEYIGLTGYDNQLRLSGDIPIDLSFYTAFTDRFLDEPIEVQMRGQDVALDFLPSFYPQLEQSKGTTDVNFNIGGTTASPYLEGNLSVRNAELKLTGFDTPIRYGKLDVQATNGRIDIPTLSFGIGKGRYAAKMHFRMNGLFPTQFEIDQFTASNAQIADFARNFLSGNIARNLKGYLTATANLRLPMDRFIIPGETAWIPQKVTFSNLNDLLKDADGEIKVQNVLIDSFGYEIRNSNKNPIKIGLEEQFLTLKGFTLEDQKTGVTPGERLKFTGFGSFDFTNHIRFNMDIKNFDLAFLSDFVPDEYSIQGSLDASLGIRGTAIQPEVVFQWNIPQRSQISINRAKIDRCSGQIVYYYDKLYIGDVPNEVESALGRILMPEEERRVNLTIGTNRLDLSGLIPFRLSFLEVIAEPLPQDIEGRLDITIGDLGFLPDLLDIFQFVSGSGSVNATIGGRLASPKLRGVAHTNGLAFDMPAIDISVEDTEIDLIFTNEGLQINRFEGTLNEGTYQISGALESNWHRVHYIDISADAEGCAFILPNYEFQCGEVGLTVKGKVEMDERVELPPLSGFVDITEGKYKRSWKELVQKWFDKASEIQFEALSDYPILRHLQFNIQLSTRNNFQVVSDLGKLKNFEVAVNGEILGRVQKPVFTGRIDLLQGGEISFFASDYPFTLTDGSYVENKDRLEFNPRYEIFAETTRPIQSVPMRTTTGEFRTKDIRITAHVSGIFNQEDAQHYPEFQVEVIRKDGEEFLSLDQKEILAILTPFGDISTLNADTFSSDFARPFFLRSSQRYVGSHVARIAGLSDFWFDLSADTPSESRIHLTRQVAERLFLTYSSTFQLHSDPRIEVEYQINRRISIKGERNDQGKYGLDLELEMRF